MNPAESMSARNAGSLLTWREFRAGLENLDVTWMDGQRNQPCSWIVDSGFGNLRIRKVGSNCLALRGERSRSRINAHQEELIWVCLALAGDIQVSQNRCWVRLAAGDMVFLDACQPYSIDVPAKQVDSLWIGSTRSFVAKHVWDIDELLGERIDGQRGAGHMASSVLRAAFLGAEASRGSPSDANRIAHALFDVLGAAADVCRVQAAGPRTRSAVVRRVKRYIDANLGDEMLTVERIAYAHGFSSRYLAKMFETESQTVSAWIWNRRLERSHASLCEHVGRKTVSEIAYDHGFKNLSHFSRVFKERFGKTPREICRRELQPLTA